MPALEQVYAASALMEWAGDRSETIPRNIFELGLKSFIGSPAYVMTYADWLAGIGDTENARALFERALAAGAQPDQAEPNEAQRVLWDRYIQVYRLPPVIVQCVTWL